VAARLWWLIHKDLVSEYRARRAWPAMLLLGVVVAVVFSVQIQLLPDQKRQIGGALLWLAIFFGGSVAIDRSCSCEKTDGCWNGLLAYSVSPTLIYWSKFLVNALALAVLECLLIPAFAALSGVELLRPLWAISLVAVLADLGFSAVGTLLSALSSGIGQGGQLLVLLVLPLVIPVVLAAAESTRLIAVGQIGDDWWRWMQLLGAFAVIYVTAGTVLFEFVIED
jgi:heme exporter protein B